MMDEVTGQKTVVVPSLARPLSSGLPMRAQCVRRPPSPHHHYRHDLHVGQRSPPPPQRLCSTRLRWNLVAKSSFRCRDRLGHRGGGGGGVIASRGAALSAFGFRHTVTPSQGAGRPRIKVGQWRGLCEIGLLRFRCRRWRRWKGWVAGRDGEGRGHSPQKQTNGVSTVVE